MYEAFFSLEDAPFVLTPDPRFLLRSKGHHEVLSTLIYGITSQKGLMALIGDVGTGKTMLCRALLRELPKDVRSALVLNPYLSDAELLGAILDDLGVERRGTTKGELMTVLSHYLLTAGGEGKTVVVVLDEAQQMSIDALEQIRILSTLETATRKLLQIVLVGQPELEEKLRRRELRQLDQRIAIRCYLKPLSRKEVFRYVDHRLRIAGLSGALPFAHAALVRIYKQSRGIPRVINLVCDRALMAAFAARAREVTPALVKAAVRNLEGERPRRRGTARRVLTVGKLGRVAAVVAGVVLLGAVAATAYRSGWSPGALQILSGSTASMQAVQQAARPVQQPVAGEQGSHAEPAAMPPDGLKSVLAQALSLWGVKGNLSEPALGPWPTAADGTPDMPAMAARYELSATWLPETTIEELRAMDLPAIVELDEESSRHPYLLKRLDGSAATLISAAGTEKQGAVSDLEKSWTHSAWVIWRNVDLLPVDPTQDPTPIVIATLALRLQKLGFVNPPMPTSNDERFRQAVRRFQASIGLEPDGIVGPRTTLALSRAVAGRFGPSLAGSTPPR